LDECLSSDDPLVKESADWARIAISRAVSGWCVIGLESAPASIHASSPGLRLHHGLDLLFGEVHNPQGRVGGPH
jgi:hypothetical protein